MELQDLIKTLHDTLPPVIFRSKVEELIPGIATAGSLANEDSAGTGPTGLFYIGRKAAYPRDAFIAWIVSRASSKKKERVAK